MKMKANYLWRLHSFPAENVNSLACLVDVWPVQSHWAPLSEKPHFWFNAFFFFCHLEILNYFEQEIQHFHFALGLAKHAPGASGHKGIFSTYSCKCLCVHVYMYLCVSAYVYMCLEKRTKTMLKITANQIFFFFFF